MRVLCLVPYPTLGASNRLRVEQYALLLRDRGIDLRISPFFDSATYEVLYRAGHTAAKARGVLLGLLTRARDLARAHRYDLALIHREALPLGPPWLERALAARRIPYVFDFDDAIFLPAVHPANRRWAWLRPPGRVREVAGRAAAVIVGNEYLASHARAWNGNVVVIPTPVDTERHRPRHRRSEDGPLVLGWVGSSTTAPYLRLLDAPLTNVARRIDIVLRVVGGGYEHGSVPVELIPYSIDGEPAQVANFDVGLLPEPDDPWTRGKGAFKALLYMAAGIPVVASGVGVNPTVVRDRVTGYIADRPEDWEAALERLALDAGLRERMGAAGRERVEQHYSLRVHAPRFADVLRSAARRTVA